MRTAVIKTSSPPMTNTERAARIRAHLTRYAQETGSDEEAMLRDFLADVAHYCDAQNLSLSEALAGAESNYLEEIPENAEPQAFHP